MQPCQIIPSSILSTLAGGAGLAVVRCGVRCGDDKVKVGLRRGPASMLGTNPTKSQTHSIMSQKPSQMRIMPGKPAAGGDHAMRACSGWGSCHASLQRGGHVTGVHIWAVACM